MKIKNSIPKLAALLFVFGGVTQAHSQDLIGSYVAVIGSEDLYNSKGARLREPWQILRQDRANFHKFGIRHSGDTNDNFFASIKNRAAMETMIKNGSVERRAANTLVSGRSDAVLVRIYGNGGRGKFVRVTVFND